jgi:hypothetical protein
MQFLDNRGKPLASAICHVWQQWCLPERHWMKARVETSSRLREGVTTGARRNPSSPWKGIRS